jgi:peptide deformylase
MENEVGSITRSGRARTILSAENPQLRRIAKPVKREEISKTLFSQMIDDLFATVIKYNLVGMAAPQVGINQRIFVVDFFEGEQRHGPYCVINPKIEMQEGELLSTEGSPCLPGLIADVVRAEHVICTGLDRYGKRICIDATGMLAICIQHEIDHLNGKLISDKAIATRTADVTPE